MEILMETKPERKYKHMQDSIYEITQEVGGYIVESEFLSNMKPLDTSYALELKRILNKLCLQIKKL